MKKYLSLLLFVSIFSIFSFSQKVFTFENIDEVGFGRASKCNAHLSFAINGPLVHRDGVPVGGYIDNFSQMKSWEDNMNQKGNFFQENGIFGLSVDGQMKLFTFSQKDEIGEMKWAFQNGPILIKDGKYCEGFSNSSKYIRSGIGFREDNIIVVIFSESPVSMPEFARMFREEGCLNAIYLDGGPYCGYTDASGSHGSLNKEAIKIQFFHQ